ncbi:MAG TPA: NACHT domain-containing protein [Acidimicrobiales bacterium]|nr:NACHT domain-containing protein [Acidimicrobiales bacterium]
MNAESEVEVLDDLPGYLETPPETPEEAFGIIAEPYLQQLPIERLGWKDFERLCLRLVKSRAEVTQCALYGVSGQYQAGIDLYARRTDGTYATYQCKRVETFTAADVSASVEKFLEGQWAETAKVFTLCTSHDLSPTGLQDAIVDAQARLADREISFEPWDKAAITLELKDEPAIVYDFFREQLARRFCGDLLIDRLSSRLATQELRALRLDLEKFYRSLFRLHDPNVTTNRVPPDRSGIHSRFVNVDVFEGREILGESPLPAPLSVPPPDEYLDRGALSSPPLPLPPIASSFDVRSHRVMDWIAGEGNHLVVGGAGSGKSALLRAIALDTLSESPRFSKVAARFAGHVPVWVPFALWVKLVSQGPAQDWSIPTLIKQWLNSSSAPEIWPLIEKALDDDRVLFLVDGLDEYTDEVSAESVFTSIYMHAERRGSAVIATSRPTALVGLDLGRVAWESARFSPLNEEQQRQIFAGVEEGRLTSEATDEPSSADLFMAKLKERTELAELATNPLLLVHMSHLWLAYKELPRSRAETFEQILHHLVDTHPDRRSRVSQHQVPHDQLNRDERASAIASLALNIQSAGTYSIPRSASERSVIEFLESPLGPGLDSSAARNAGRVLVANLIDHYGVLQPVTESEVGFFHASMREYLSARAINSLDSGDRLRLVEEHATDASWAEVFRHLLALASDADVTELIRTLEVVLTRRPDLFWLDLVLAKSATSSRLPAEVSSALLLQAVELIEERPWSPNRTELIRAVVSALGSDVGRAVVEPAINRWFPYRFAWITSGIRAIASWRPDEEVVACLVRGLRQFDDGARQAAGLALGGLAPSAHFPAAKLLRLGRTDQDPEVRAASILALSFGRTEETEPLLRDASASEVPQLRLVAAIAKVRAGQTDQSDLEILLDSSRDGRGLDRGWMGLAASTIRTGWTGDNALRDRVLEAYRAGRNRRAESGEFDGNFLVALLLRTFPNDPVVGAAIAEEMPSDYPFIGYMMRGDPWVHLAQNFRDDPILVPAIDEWIVRQNSAHSVERHYAALVGRTPIAKQALLAAIGEWSPHWEAHALLEGWGMEDADVAAAMVALIDRDASDVSRVAHLVPRIVQNSEEARNRLKSMLMDPACARPDFVLDGLFEVGLSSDEDEILDEVVRRLENGESEGFRHRAIEYFNHDQRMRDVALSELAKPEGVWGAVATSFSEDQEIRSTVLRSLSPLDTRGRAVLINALSKGGPPDAVATDVLSGYRSEYDSNVATSAAITYYKWRVENGDQVSVRSELIEELVVRGLHHESRSQAAFASALAIGIPDVMLEASFDWRQDARAAVRITDFIRPNLPLLRMVLEHWAELKALFGDEFWFRLGDDMANEEELWKALVSVADEYPRPRDEALEYLQGTGPTHPPYHQSAEVLAFLARCLPKSELLRDFCVSTATAEVADLGGWQGAEYAAELLGAHFGGSDDVLQLILKELHPGPPFPPDFWRITSGAICALAEGWPDSEYIDRAWGMLTTDASMRIHEGAEAHLVAARANADGVINWICNRASEVVVTEAPNIRARRRAIQFRIAEDKEVQSKLIDLLMAPECSPSLSVTCVSLLSGGHSLDEELLKYSQEAVKREMDPSVLFSTLGFDVGTDAYRGLVEVLATTMNAQLSD